MSSAVYAKLSGHLSPNKQIIPSASVTIIIYFWTCKLSRSRDHHSHICDRFTSLRLCFTISRSCLNSLNVALIQVPRWRRSGQISTAPSSIERIEDEIRLVRLANDSKHRVDGHCWVRLGSGRCDARRSLLQDGSCKDAGVWNGARDGERYPRASDCERRASLQLPTDLLRQRGPVSAAIYDCLRPAVTIGSAKMKAPPDAMHGGALPFSPLTICSKQRPAGAYYL